MIGNRQTLSFRPKLLPKSLKAALVNHFVELLNIRICSRVFSDLVYLISMSMALLLRIRTQTRSACCWISCIDSLVMESYPDSYPV